MADDDEHEIHSLDDIVVKRERTTKGRLVVHNGIPDCSDCHEHAFGQPMLGEACASVGIEHGKSTYEMFKSYIAAYHFRGHRD